MENIVNEANFSEILSANKVVLVDFWASWCGPCRMLAPVVEKLSQEMPDKFDFYKMNVDEENDLASQYGIMSIPTLLVFKNGEMVEQSVGVKGESQLKAMLTEYAD